MFSILIKSEEGYIGVDDLYGIHGKNSFTDIDDKEKAREKLNALKVIYPHTNFVLMKVVSSTSDDDDGIPF